VDKLNNKAYAQHYRNLDSARIYADSAFALSVDYDDGKAEALNNPCICQHNANEL
jgi:hypothetical protein